MKAAARHDKMRVLMRGRAAIGGWTIEHNEIATMLECSTGNSKSQLHKARLKLRELLRQTEQLAQPAQAKDAVQ